MKKKISVLAEVPTPSGPCPIGIVKESLARDNCNWKFGWTIGFAITNEALCIEDTASSLTIPESEFMDMAAEVAGRNIYLRCYPAQYDPDGEDVHCLIDIFFKSERTAKRFVKRLVEYGKEKCKKQKENEAADAAKLKSKGK